MSGEVDALSSFKPVWGPFASLIRDPDTYEKFSEVVLIQTTREKNELIYAKDLVSSLQQDPLIGEYAQQLKFYPMTTREPSEHMGRITTVMESGCFFETTGLPKIHPDEDRVMICGSMAMLKDYARMCESFGLVEGADVLVPYIILWSALFSREREVVMQCMLMQ